MIADRASHWMRSNPRKSRLLQWMLLAAVLFHLLWLASFLFGPRLYALITGHPMARLRDRPPLATIEMIMQKTKTSGGDHYLKTPEAPPGRPGSPGSKPARQAARPAPPEPESKDGFMTPSAPSQQTQAAQAQPAQPAAPGNPGTGLVSGDSVVPDSPDDKHPNLPPAYPTLAATLNEGGEVRLLIHIGANGIPVAVDIIKSSGYLVLDETARKAALSWHFRPVMQGGVAVPSEMPFTFNFDNSADGQNGG